MTELNVPYNALAIMCVDDRLHEHSLVPQIKQLTGAERVFVRTLVGPEDRILAGSDSVHVQSLRLSMEKLLPIKNITIVAVIGHCDCAGHPVSDLQHEEDSIIVSGYLKGLFPNITFIPMLASPTQPGQAWDVKLVDNVVPIFSSSSPHTLSEAQSELNLQEASGA